MLLLNQPGNTRKHHLHRNNETLTVVIPGYTVLLDGRSTISLDPSMPRRTFGSSSWIHPVTHSPPQTKPCQNSFYTPKPEDLVHHIGVPFGIGELMTVGRRTCLQLCAKCRAGRGRWSIDNLNKLHYWKEKFLFYLYVCAVGSWEEWMTVHCTRA